MSIEDLIVKVINRFEETVESDLKYDGSLDDIDFFGLFCKATARDKLYKFLGVNVCMFNCIYGEDEDAVLIVFSIPVNSNSSTKNTADRVMEVVELAERCFITLDSIESREIKDEKFIYVTIVKRVNSKKGDCCEREKS